MGLLADNTSIYIYVLFTLYTLQQLTAYIRHEMRTVRAAKASTLRDRLLFKQASHAVRSQMHSMQQPSNKSVLSNCRQLIPSYKHIDQGTHRHAHHQQQLHSCVFHANIVNSTMSHIIFSFLRSFCRRSAWTVPVFPASGEI